MHTRNRITLALSLLMLSAGSAVAQDDPDATDAAAAAEEAAIAQQEKSWLDEWSGGVDLGLDGSSGNTDRTSFRAGFNAKRETSEMVTKARLSYLWSQQDSDETENRFLASLRNDWILGDSPWRLFVEGTWEMDEFKDWDHRVSVFGGVGYEFIKDDKQTLLGLAGLGATKEIGAEDEDVYPEAMLGLEYDYNIKKGHKFAAATYLYPNLDETGEYRWNSLAAYEILLDEATSLYLKLGVENQYDSDPGPDTEKNDFYYFVSLGWAFYGKRQEASTIALLEPSSAILNPEKDSCRLNQPAKRHNRVPTRRRPRATGTAAEASTGRTSTGAWSYRSTSSPPSACWSFSSSPG